jgi:hypothetical protein
MVMYYNGSVENWKNLLAENELDKIEAMAARDKYLKENRSFDGGSSYSYSERRDTTWAKTQNYSRKAGGWTKRMPCRMYGWLRIRSTINMIVSCIVQG